MNRNLVFVTLIFAFCHLAQSATVSTVSPDDKCPNESLRENCIHSLFMIGSPDSQFPNSTQQIDSFCGKLKETDKCIKDYTNRCMSPTGKRATLVAVAGISRLLRRMCRHAEKRKEFVRNAKCGNAVIGDMKSCLSDYKMALYGAQQVESNHKLPIVCCKFHDFRKCVRNGFDRVGAQVCPDESRQYFARIADAFQSDVFDLICSNYDDGSDKCDNIIVVPEVTPSNDTQSLIKPLREVLRSIIEDSDRQ